MTTANANWDKTKKTLVLVHGYLGGSRQWEKQRSYFSRYFNLLTPELPGFGDSHHSTTPDSITELASNVLQQLEKARVGKFHLLGHSMGGMIAQQMVELSADRVDRLILYGTGANGQMPGRFETIEESREKIKSQGVLATSQQIAATWFVSGSIGEGFAICAELAAKASLQAAVAGLTAMEKWSGVAALRDIKSKTLVLWGDKDRAYLWSQPEQLWSEIAGAQLAVVPGCSHAVHVEKPHLFNPILLDFLLQDES